MQDFEFLYLSDLEVRGREEPSRVRLHDLSPHHRYSFLMTLMTCSSPSEVCVREDGLTKPQLEHELIALYEGMTLAESMLNTHAEKVEVYIAPTREGAD